MGPCPARDEAGSARARDCAGRFVDLIFPSHQLRASMGEPHDVLFAEAPARVEWVLRLLEADGAFADPVGAADTDGGALRRP